ncbi:MAG: tRNA (adenosine(37)-N6)-threonylcarbamoyltransferase complex transferase subunit TsaD [bacterium]|nr:tRNA (adenosine(37)-N6)-threonylcarbamoyltransferase complex transferase subunit TsaD [bacterium]
MNILAIESSCDETAAAVIKSTGQRSCKILSNIIASQAEIHAKYGGVVPEVAARSHIEVIIPVIEKALGEAKLNWQNIDAIAVTKGPGLIGSLLIGVLTAKILAEIYKLPLIGINHIFAHPFANFLTDNPPKFPLLALIVSGGHTQLMLVEKNLKFNLLGATCDDAAGEAFDKIAKLIGLGYPGGPAISKTAQDGNKNKYQFPTAKLDYDLDFSFSGLKTAVLRQVLEIVGQSRGNLKKSYDLSPKITSDIAASFQANVVSVLVEKTLLAKSKFQPKTVVVGGGVAANTLLRQTLTKAIPQAQFVEPILCTDNAAMIGALGYQMARLKMFIRPEELKADSSLETI